MRQKFLILVCLLAAIASAGWLTGYVRALWPFLPYEIKELDLNILTYPTIEWFADSPKSPHETGRLKILWFCTTDSPTGDNPAHGEFPCWIVSLAALGLLVCSLGWVAVLWSDRHQRP